MIRSQPARPHIPWAWLVRIGVLWGLLALVPAGRAAAQVDAETDTTAASADSLGQEGDDMLGGEFPNPDEGPPPRQGTPGSGDLLEILKPSYDTTYDVDRQRTTWNQNFDFGTTLKFMSLANKTNFLVGTDSGLNEDTRAGKNSSTLRFTMIKKLPITTKIDLGHASKVRPGDERKNDDASATASANYNTMLLGIRNSLSLGGGYIHHRSEVVSRNVQTVTTDGGWSGSFQWRGNWVYKTLTVGMNYGDEKRKKESVLIRPGQENTTNPSTTTNRRYGTTVNFNPLAWVKSNLTWSKSSGSDQLFVAPEGKLEHKVNNSQNLRTSVSLTPTEDLKIDGSVTSRRSDLGLRVRKEQATKSHGLSWDGKVQATLLGIKSEASMSSQDDVTEPLTSASLKNRTHIFDGKLSRPLSEKLEAKFNWLVRATQLFFYNDPNPDHILDRDELRTKLQPSLKYKPNDRWIVNASYVRSTSRRVELNPTRALQTQEDEDFQVNLDIDYTLSSRTHLSQNYLIEAVYTTFDFNRRSDRLLETQRITTVITTQMTPHVGLRLEHAFSLQDSGPFRFEPDGTRVFTRNLRKYRQSLATGLTYKVNSWLSFSVDSRFLRTDDVSEASGRRTILRNLDLRQGAKVERDLGKGASMTASADFVRNSFQASYWKISSSLNKEF